MLSVKNISKKFQNKLIVDDVSFDVQPGEIVVLLGQSGVGKINYFAHAVQLGILRSWANLS